MTRPFPFLTAPQWHQGQRPRLCPLWLQGWFCRSRSPSWQSFTMARTLHPGLRLLRCLRPPSHTLAFSRPPKRPRGVGVPQFQDRRRVEIPVAACCGPGAYGTTYRHRRSVGTTHHPILGQGYQPLSLVRFHGLSTQVPSVSIGIRSGRSTAVWLRVAERLSLGFPPSRVPLVDAGQVDLTPLFMCNPLHGLSICPVKERGRPKAGAQRTLEGVGCRRWFGKASASCAPAPVCPARLLDHLIGQEEQGGGQRDPERLGGLEVNDQFVLHGHLDR